MPQAVAHRYARALADAVLDPAAQLEPKQALAELRQFSAMLAGSVELRSVLLSPAVAGSRKRAVIAKFGDIVPYSRLVRNFLYVLVDRRRISSIAEIAEAFETTLDERLGILRAEVRAASHLTDAQQAAMTQTLSRMTGKQVRCEFSTDPALLGGAVARIGSTVYDGSVRGQLEALRERLVKV